MKTTRQKKPRPERDVTKRCPAKNRGTGDRCRLELGHDGAHSILGPGSYVTYDGRTAYHWNNW